MPKDRVQATDCRHRRSKIACPEQDRLSRTLRGRSPHRCRFVSPGSATLRPDVGRAETHLGSKHARGVERSGFAPNQTIDAFVQARIAHQGLADCAQAHDAQPFFYLFFPSLRIQRQRARIYLVKGLFDESTHAPGFPGQRATTVAACRAEGAAGTTRFATADRPEDHRGLSASESRMTRCRWRGP